jgi:soluble lytic murein transglycosylase-like protein
LSITSLMALKSTLALAVFALMTVAAAAQAPAHKAPVPQPRPSVAITGADRPSVLAETQVELPPLDPPYARPLPQAVAGRPFPKQAYAKGRDTYIENIRKLAQEHDIPVDIADVIIQIESDYDPAAIGDNDAIGLMQIRPVLARDLRFGGPINDLFDPDINLKLGMNYLAGAWKLSSGKVCDGLLRYREGWMETRETPESRDHCRRALIRLAILGSNLGADIDMPGLAQIRSSLRGRSRFDWRDHDNRIKAIDDRFGGENFGIISK